MRLLEQRRDTRDLGRRLRRSRVVRVALARTPFADVGVMPARMSTPGAVTSGFKKFASVAAGPRDEKSAMTLPVVVIGTKIRTPA